MTPKAYSYLFFLIILYIFAFLRTTDKNVFYIGNTFLYYSSLGETEVILLKKYTVLCVLAPPPKTFDVLGVIMNSGLPRARYCLFNVPGG